MTQPEKLSTTHKAFATVAVPSPLYASFDYKLNDDQRRTAKPGMRVAVSFGRRTMIGIILELKNHCDFDERKVKEVNTVYNTHIPFNETLLALLTWAASYYSHPIGEVLSNALPAALRKNQAPPEYQSTLWQRTSKAFEGRANAHKQIRALATLEKTEAGLWDDALRVLGFNKSLLEKLENEGYVEKQQSLALSKAMARTQEVHEPEQSYRLNAEQQNAVHQITQQANGFKAHLLEGVTGSGKTEVYIEAVRHCISQDQQALILVPEINLTPQTFERFQNQLGVPIAVLHSGMTEKERVLTYTLVQTGQAKVLIGTRSAIFTPCANLGLIVIDEEHDASYKQSDGFKYSARDLAVKRAQLESASIVLGSATPSSESILNAQQGRFNLIKLNARANQAKPPRIALEDMRALKRDIILSPRTLAEIKKELDQDNQVIIFHNRRGLAPSLMCFDCGWICQCSNCDARFTVHNRPARLHCHHCDAQIAIPTHCGQCQSSNVNTVGSGTEKLEQIIQYYFPKRATVRLDRDEIKTQNDLELRLDIIKKGEPCLIIGTQMLAKGHDFPDVTLVVVVDADGLFFSSDFRALEKGAQQLIQVAGRAGRGSKSGRVLIQTRQTDNPLFSFLKQHDYASFMAQELDEREICELPPYSRLLNIRAESTSAQSGETALNQLKQTLSILNIENILISGPLPAAITRKQNRFRHNLHIFCGNAKDRYFLQQHIIHFIQHQTDRKLRLSIDVDPTEIN